LAADRTTAPCALGSLVDLDRYPIHDPDAIAAIAAAAHDDLVARGVAVLPGFLHDHGVAAVIAEAETLAPLAHHSTSESTVYLAASEPGAAPASPRGHLVQAVVGVVAYDLFPAGSALRAMYEDDAVLAFVAAVLGRSPLYRYSDPFGALNLAVMGDGDELGWHFDMTDFVVSLAIRSSDVGGEFEMVSRIRSTDDPATDAIAAVLAGDRSAVETLPMLPGTLVVFEGRWSMHRVVSIAGDTDRLVALLAYDTEPGTDSTDRLKLVRYGRLPGERVSTPTGSGVAS
jgi:hypothetical protein